MSWTAAGSKSEADGQSESRERGGTERAWWMLAICAVLLSSAPPVSAKNDGIDTSQMEGPVSSCGSGACHIVPDVPDPDLTVTISGPSELNVNDIQTYTISITGQFGAGILGAGVHVAAFMDDVLQDIDDDVLFSLETNTQITTALDFGATGQRSIR